MVFEIEKSGHYFLRQIWDLSNTFYQEKSRAFNLTSCSSIGRVVRILTGTLDTFRALSTREIGQTAVFDFLTPRFLVEKFLFVVVWRAIGVVQMTINSVNVMEWRKWFSSLFVLYSVLDLSRESFIYLFSLSLP